jgi:hypothetical protein
MFMQPISVTPPPPQPSESKHCPQIAQQNCCSCGWLWLSDTKMVLYPDGPELYGKKF